MFGSGALLLYKHQKSHLSNSSVVSCGHMREQVCERELEVDFVEEFPVYNKNTEHIFSDVKTFN